MNINIKNKKLKLLKKYTDPKLQDIVKRMNTTRSAFYKGYINDESVDKVFNEVYVELENLLNEFKAVKEDEEITNYVNTHQEEILKKFGNNKLVIKDIFKKEVKKMIKKSNKP